MQRKNAIKSLLVATGLALLTACGSSEYLVKDPLVMLEYGKSPDEVSLENLTKAYSSAINKNRKANITEPGLFADYACALALQGRAQEANVYFNKEMEAYPSSRNYVLQLKKKLIPQFLNSNEINEDGLFDQQDYDAKAAARHAAAEERAASVMDPTNNAVDAAAGVETPADEEAKPADNEATPADEASAEENLDNDEETLKDNQ